jgi:hypothetical protein
MALDSFRIVHSDIWQVNSAHMESFFNSRATHVQSPTVTLIVQNKRKLKKTSITTDLDIFIVITTLSVFICY